jgi:hypothetical protein
MKEITLKIGNIWSLITAIIIMAMLCATAVFISLQSNKTQWDIAENQAKATRESANKITEGLESIGRGVCKSGNDSVYGCGF